jgi:hypothetical protein
MYIPPAYPKEMPRPSMICSENIGMRYRCASTCRRGNKCEAPPLARILPEESSFEVFHTENRGQGLRSKVALPAGKILLIYTGEVICRDEAERRDHEVYSESKVRNDELVS